MTIFVRWPRMDMNVHHTGITSVQRLRQLGHEPEFWLNDGTWVYIGMPGNAARAAGIPDERVGPFGKPWECLRAPEGWRYAYVQYLKRRLRDDPDFREAVRGLHGKSLVCWCKGSKRGLDPDCHGDLLATEAERLYHESE